MKHIGLARMRAQCAFMVAMGMATTTLSYLTVQPDGIPDAPIVHPSMDDAFTKVPVGETSFNQSVVQSCADMSVLNS